VIGFGLSKLEVIYNMEIRKGLKKLIFDMICGMKNYLWHKNTLNSLECIRTELLKRVLVSYIWAFRIIGCRNGNLFGRGNSLNEN